MHNLRFFKNKILNTPLVIVMGVLLLIQSIWIIYTNFLIQEHKSVGFITALLILISGIFEILFAVKNYKRIDIWVIFLFSGIAIVLVSLFLALNNDTELNIYLLIFYAVLVSIKNIMVITNLKAYGMLEWKGNVILNYISFLIIILGTFRFINGFSIFPDLPIVFFVNFILMISFYNKMEELNSIPEKVSRNIYMKIEDIKNEYFAALKKNWDADRDLYM